MTKLIGLDVVGRLAARHGITVTLAAGDGGGIVATVSVPERLLVPTSDLPAPRRPVSALVAAAAFRPALASGGENPLSPLADDARVREPEPVAVAAPEFVRPGVPRRIRGAQLPDLGPDRKDGPHVAPDAGRVRGRLHAMQAGNVRGAHLQHPTAPATTARLDLAARRAGRFSAGDARSSIRRR